VRGKGDKMAQPFRMEADALGSVKIPAESLFGIHAWRARENFPNTDRFSLHWYQAVGTVKLACYNTIERFQNVVEKKFGKAPPIKMMVQEKIEALQEAAREVTQGKHFEFFIVPAVQGGAGTSVNMNVNEILSNVALEKLGKAPGTYAEIDPIEDANRYQSTNDVIPTALHVACMQRLPALENRINLLRHEIEKLEAAHRNHLRIAYTQMQAAVPSSLGRLFSTYNEALSRDWWRISRGQERLKVVNLGGSAIGSGLASPRFFVMEAIHELQKLTGLPVTRSENMHDATCNLDPFVEVHGFLTAHAVSLEKMAGDLRLLASDLIGANDIRLPRKQVGSSIMPGKVNPVIPEFVIGCAHKVYANGAMVNSLAAQGLLDLNAYLPIIGHAFLDSLELLIAANRTLQENLFCGLKVNIQAAEEKLYHSPSVCTALLPCLGYRKAALLAKEMQRSGGSIHEANRTLQLIDPEKLEEHLAPSNLLKEGFSVHDLVGGRG
jgi:aspartate ammonia-lyase